MIVLSFESLPFFIDADFLHLIQNALLKNHQLTSRLFFFGDNHHQPPPPPTLSPPLLTPEESIQIIHERLRALNTLTQNVDDTVIESRVINVDVAISSSAWLLSLPKDPLHEAVVLQTETAIAETLQLCGGTTTHLLIYLQITPREVFSQILQQPSLHHLDFHDVLEERKALEQRIRRWMPMTPHSIQIIPIPLNYADNKISMQVLAEEIALLVKTQATLRREPPSAIEIEDDMISGH